MAIDESKWYGQNKKDNWQTPSWLYEPIDDICNIDLDPCAGSDTEIGDENWSIARGEDGLEREWFGTVFVNPPFSNKSEWVNKIEAELSNTDLILLVTPDSTDVQSWWHDGIVPNVSYVWFAEGRISYIDPDEVVGGSPSRVGTASDETAETANCCRRPRHVPRLRGD